MGIPMTKEGFDALHQELNQLRQVERIKIVDEIEAAREHGDLKENAEYHAAKERQAFIEGRISEIEGKIAHAEVIDTSKLSGTRITFGATVVLYDTDEDQEISYRIVGEDESDLAQQKLSCTSPIAKAIIGKEEGDEVQIKTPGGLRTLEICEVSFK